MNPPPPPRHPTMRPRTLKDLIADPTVSLAEVVAAAEQAATTPPTPPPTVARRRRVDPVVAVALTVASVLVLVGTFTLGSFLLWAVGILR